MEDALCPEQRASTKLERYYFVALRDAAAARVFALAGSGARLCGPFPYIFLIHVRALLVSILKSGGWSVSGGGLKEETHRQVRFRRWVGKPFLAC
jgi:hypothetical protein